MDLLDSDLQEVALAMVLLVSCSVATTVVWGSEVDRIGLYLEDPAKLAPEWILFSSDRLASLLTLMSALDLLVLSPLTLMSGQDCSVSCLSS